MAEAHKGCDGKGMSATWPQLLAGCYGDGWGRRHGKKKKKKKKGIFIIRACLWCKYAERERWVGMKKEMVGTSDGVWWWWWLTMGISGGCGTHIFWMGPTSRWDRLWGSFFGLVWKHPVAATINGPFRALSLSHPYIHTLPLTLSLPLKNFVAFFSLSVLDLQ